MRRRALALAGAAACVAVLAAGCGSSGESAGTFATRILREEISGQWAAQWGELHPGHQKLIDRAQYVTCSEGMATNVGTGHETFTVTGVRDEAIHVRGVPERTATLVTVRVTGIVGQSTAVFHLHAVRDRGRWRWILGPSFLQALDHGKCLDGSALSPGS